MSHIRGEAGVGVALPSRDLCPEPSRPLKGFRGDVTQSHADELAAEVARLTQVERRSAERVRVLEAALRALLEDFERLLKASDIAPALLRDVPTVLKEARRALDI